MKAPYFQVDAFTCGPFTGNPAGVCLLDRWLPDSQLQQIAFENGLSETAFVVREKKSYALRWFTPTIEVDLCGHATLATAHVLQAHFAFSPPWRFLTRSGELLVSREEDLLVLDFPARPAAACESAPDLIQGLRATPVEVFRAQDYLAVFATEAEIHALQPDFAALARLGGRGIIATAPGVNCDFVSRFFAPAAGIPEDPVTGSAHCTLMPYWAARLGRSRLFARQVSVRGGELWCELRDDRVLISGRAVTYLEGHIHLPAAN